MEIIIVKIGTESLQNFDASLKVQNMVDGIARLMSRKVGVILVSSWAVWEWKSIAPHIQNKARLASIGQHILLKKYWDKFNHHGIIVGQFLPTHAQIEDNPQYRDTFFDTLTGALADWILPIVNENDTCSTYEMRELERGIDNDKNALLMAQLFRARSIVLITNTNGVYSEVDNPMSRISFLPWSKLDQRYIISLCWEKSPGGTGGMQSKLSIGHEASQTNIQTHICDGITTGVWEHSDLHYRWEKGWTVIT